MAIPNLLSLLLLSGVVFEEVKRFEKEKRGAVEGSASEEDNSKEQAAKKQDTDETRTVEIDGLEI
jgi:AGCS family alanine or glycine:cation symporter